MDCNSYSYAPYMLDEERPRLAYYENDDMYAELYVRFGKYYNVYAFSYDGQLDVAEEFSDKDKAQRLYDYIMENYTGSPPGEELQDFIRDLLYDGRYTYETEEDFSDEN